MINFEEELAKFHPSLEVSDAEDAIYSNEGVTDLADILVSMMQMQGQQARQPQFQPQPQYAYPEPEVELDYFNV